MIWTVVAAWLTLSVPVSLVLARLIDPQLDRFDAAEAEFVVIADADRRPLPPHLRRTEPVADPV